MATTTDTRNLGWFKTFLVAAVVLLVLVGVGVFMRAGRVSFDKAVALGEAVTSDSASLFDKALIAAKAEALGVTVSFSPDFAQNGQVVVNSWIPQASVCLYLPSTEGWATRVSDEPCEEVGAREGPEAVPPDERALAGISDPQPWAEEDDPLIAAGHGSQASGYGDVYVQAHGSERGEDVVVHGFNKVSGEPGPKAYFEASLSVRCQPIEGCQYREVAQGVSGRTSSRTFTPASTLIHVPGDTTSVRVGVRQCLDIKLMLGNDVCTDWSLVGPIDVPNPYASGADP